eukprot:CAMPEP_0117015480 /NCGR_PEP_ID=MMETSP0472-20121206/12362_1 /TAXON_ID=693140 ORGANISM="Tiarina fusus, Strain LIS" /NCGR_SAMPLE_ID=MMETSP0472 /ASSEMBLY_ACC=CAM_ASM_000603 /LENGTH=135 /DNA_ID=CAMNT_0004719295 /DNA_START=63 /DNA_END=468 /DNA_ORIENTATION=+
MTIEAVLTRELSLRFIDARNIATEARLNLQIHHYPTKDQEQAILQEACRIFNSRPEEQRCAMQRMSADLRSIKAPSSCCGSVSLASLKKNSDHSKHSSNNGSEGFTDHRQVAVLPPATSRLRYEEIDCGLFVADD